MRGLSHGDHGHVDLSHASRARTRGFIGYGCYASGTMSAVVQASTQVSPPRRMSVDTWAGLPEDDRSELVQGCLVEEEMPSVIHEAVVAWLIGVLRQWAATNDSRVFGSGLKYVIGELTGRLPDATVYLRGSKRPPPRGPVRFAPSIAIEVVSASPADGRRDRVEKLREYASFGVRWYWLVDPELRTFEILELDDTAAYRHVVGATEGKIDPVPGCERLVLDVSALFQELDEIISEGGASEE